jgi:hypothetical protein
MARGPRGALAALFLAGLAAAAPAAAAQLTTTIDLDYKYTQENLDEDVKAKTQYNQKYEVKYETSLTSGLDFIGAVRLELEDIWNTNEPNTSKVAPTLEFETKGSQSAVKGAYEVVLNTTDPYQEAGEIEAYSTSAMLEVQLTPLVWPETKLKLQRKSDYEPYATESTTDTLELTVLKDFSGLRLEFNLKLEGVDDVLPERATTDTTDWAGKATYKEVLWGGTEFELAYEIKESYVEDESRGVFVSETEDYTQQLKTRLKNSLQISPRITLGVTWEYQFEQDLFVLEFDYKLKNKYLAELRWDAMDWFKVTGEARRETELTAAVPGEDDEQTVTDTFKAGFDVLPVAWLRFTGKAEIKRKDDLTSGSGASVDQLDEEKYEVGLKNKFGDFWDLNLTGTTSTKHEDGWLLERETKLKAELKLKLAELTISPSYETSRKNEWDWGFEDPAVQTQTRDGKIKFEYKMQLLDLLAATFTHEYGIKCEDQLDEVLNFERTLQLSEDTRLNLVVTDLIRDLRIEGEIERKGSDTEDDADPELVEVAWSLKFEWKLDELTLGSSVKYNDKGDTFDDLSLNTKVVWKGERLELTGEYQLDKVYAEVTDEERKLNLKLNYKF